MLVAQDTTRYGEDLYTSRANCRGFLKRLCALDGDFYIRVLYCYPDFLTEELLDTMAGEPKILNYLDLPLQHCSGRILRAMHRWGDRGKLEALLAHVREKVPGVTLRTTLMVGFPGETEEDFEELCEFAKRVRFDHMGCFAYSAEEGTEAAALPDQIDEDVKSHRVEVLMEQQMALEQAAGEALVGKTVRVLVEGWDRWAECWFARAASQAPDDIDGKVYFHVPKDAKRRPVLGQFAEVEIADCLDGDLVGAYQGKRGAGRMLNLPNKLSILRIVLVPFFVAFLVYDFVPYHTLWALLLFLVASYTDHLDGKLARARNEITSFGKFLDPLADKILILSALVCFAQLRLCSVWVPLIVLLREFAVTSLRLVAVENGRVIAANLWGKAKTVTQMAASIYMLFVQTLASFGVPAGAAYIDWLSASPGVYAGLLLFGNVLLWLSCVMTIVSGIVYIRDNFDVLRHS